MFCKKCGKTISEKEEICPKCGAKTTDEVTKEDVARAKANVDAAAKELGDELKRRIGKKGLFAVGAVILAVILILGVILFSTSCGMSDTAMCVVASEGKLKLLKDIGKNKTLEICSVSGDVDSGLAMFTPDHKYICFFSGLNSDLTGTLCRTEVSKLKNGSDKNREVVEVVEEKVISYQCQLFDDGTILYKNAYKALSYYDGEKSVTLSGNVDTFAANESKRVIIFRWDGSSYTILSGSADGSDEMKTLADEVIEVVDSSDPENILFTKWADDGANSDMSLYRVGVSGGEVGKLGDNASVFGVSSDGTVYFSNKCEEMAKFGDYVDDPYLDADSKAKRPDRDDYTYPTYSFFMINERWPSEGNKELYTSLTKPVSILPTNPDTNQNYSIKEYCEGKTTFENDYQKALNDFYQKYKATGEAEEFFPVTDEMKEELKHLINPSGGEIAKGEETQWLRFCYYRMAGSRKVDYDAYNAALIAWDEVKTRESLRISVSSGRFDCPVSELYSCKNGRVESLGLRFTDSAAVMGGRIIKTLDQLENSGKRFDLNEISLDVARGFFLIDRSKANSVLFTENGQILRLSESAAKQFGEACDNYIVSFGISGGSVYLSDMKGNLYIGKVSGSVIESLNLLTDNGIMIDADDTTIWYADNVHDNGDTVYADICSYKDDRRASLAGDVILGQTDIYDDGIIVAVTGDGLKIFENGKSREIAKDAGKYSRVDENTILYISDGNLYTCDMKSGKSRLLCENADKFWPENRVDSHFYLTLR